MLNEPVTIPGHDQSSYRLRLEWGPTGAEAVRADYAVVVDVLSFTTTLSVAVERGIEVFPFRWRDARAAEHAMRHAATLAVGRFEALSRGDARHVSLSPASLAEVEGVERLVLPSPNGSTIAFALADAGSSVVGACLRNAGAVARWLAPRVAAGASVVVVPAGERWYDDTLRPAAEDLWGAGAVLDALLDAPGVDAGASPEARMAVAAWRAADLPGDLLDCAGGRELREAGFVADVEIAAQHDVSEVVPVLVGESFRDAATLPPDGPRLRRVGS
jgi:2-phosphosulfolactate phosphatase